MAGSMEGFFFHFRTRAVSLLQASWKDPGNRENLRVRYRITDGRGSQRRQEGKDEKYKYREYVLAKGRVISYSEEERGNG